MKFAKKFFDVQVNLIKIENKLQNLLYTDSITQIQEACLKCVNSYIINGFKELQKQKSLLQSQNRALQLKQLENTKDTFNKLILFLSNSSDTAIISNRLNEITSLIKNDDITDGARYNALKNLITLDITKGSAYINAQLQMTVWLLKIERLKLKCEQHKKKYSSLTVLQERIQTEKELFNELNQVDFEPSIDELLSLLDSDSIPTLPKENSLEALSRASFSSGFCAVAVVDDIKNVKSFLQHNATEALITFKEIRLTEIIKAFIEQEKISCPDFNERHLINYIWNSVAKEFNVQQKKEPGKYEEIENYQNVYEKNDNVKQQNHEKLVAYINSNMNVSVLLDRLADKITASIKINAKNDLFLEARELQRNMDFFGKDDGIKNESFFINIEEKNHEKYYTIKQDIDERVTLSLLKRLAQSGYLEGEQIKQQVTIQFPCKIILFLHWVNPLLCLVTDAYGNHYELWKLLNNLKNNADKIKIIGACQKIAPNDFMGFLKNLIATHIVSAGMLNMLYIKKIIPQETFNILLKENVLSFNDIKFLYKKTLLSGETIKQHVALAISNHKTDKFKITMEQFNFYHSIGCDLTQVDLNAGGLTISEIIELKKQNLVTAEQVEKIKLECFTSTLTAKDLRELKKLSINQPLNISQSNIFNKKLISFSDVVNLITEGVIDVIIVSDLVNDEEFKKIPTMNFDKLTLAEITFENTMVNKFSFKRTHLQGLKTTNIYFIDSNFSSSCIDGGDFSATTAFIRANFTNARIKTTNFDNAYLNNANFQYAKLEGTSFNYASLQNANFTNSLLTSYISDNYPYSGETVVISSFKHADLTKANFANCKLANAYGSSYKKNDLTSIQNNQFLSLHEGLSFAHALLQQANFRGATFNIILSNSWSNLKIIYTSFKYADLTRADFTKCDLRFADLTNAKCNQTNFSGANIDDTTKLIGVDLEQVIGLSKEEKERWKAIQQKQIEKEAEKIRIQSEEKIKKQIEKEKEERLKQPIKQEQPKIEDKEIVLEVKKYPYDEKELLNMTTNVLRDFELANKEGDFNYGKNLSIEKNEYFFKFLNKEETYWLHISPKEQHAISNGNKFILLIKNDDKFKTNKVKVMSIILRHINHLVSEGIICASKVSLHCLQEYAKHLELYTNTKLAYQLVPAFNCILYLNTSNEIGMAKKAAFMIKEFKKELEAIGVTLTNELQLGEENLDTGIYIMRDNYEQVNDDKIYANMKTAIYDGADGRLIRELLEIQTQCKAEENKDGYIVAVQKALKSYYVNQLLVRKGGQKSDDAEIVTEIILGWQQKTLSDKLSKDFISITAKFFAEKKIEQEKTKQMEPELEKKREENVKQREIDKQIQFFKKAESIEVETNRSIFSLFYTTTNYIAEKVKQFMPDCG